MTIKLTDFAWRRALDEIEAVRNENDGELPASIRKGIAARLRVTDRHLRRLIDKQEVREMKRDSYVYLRWQATAPNAVWQQDSAWAHVAVLDRGRPVHPVVEFIIDDY